jgi:hypothetical protein
LTSALVGREWSASGPGRFTPELKIIFIIIIIIIIIIAGVRISPLGSAATTGPFYQPQMIYDGDCGAIGGMKIGKGKAKYSEKTCPSATLSTTNPTWPDPGSNPGRRGGKPATNRLSYVTDFKQ